jgi:hypothetical protein
VTSGNSPPFGFFGPTYLGELAIAVPLFDPFGRIADLKGRVAQYPEALRRRVVQDYLWSAEFELHAFAPKFAHRAGIFLTASTIARGAHSLIMVLFALNRRYFVNDKTALAEVAAFPLCPPAFGERVEALLSSVGSTSEDLEHASGTRHGAHAGGRGPRRRALRAQVHPRCRRDGGWRLRHGVRRPRTVPR